MALTPLTTASKAGQARLTALYDRFQQADDNCRRQVEEIINQVRHQGDAALVEYTRRFDSPAFEAAQLRVSEAEIEAACAQVDHELMGHLRRAEKRIREFHEREREQSWIETRENGVITGRLVLPVDSAGLYVPGGQGGSTPLVSSVLMNGVPAGIAGVKRRVMLTPPDAEGKVNPALLAAAREIGISEIYKAGSAWAIAALAYGTESIAPVDVIVGPGNQYVTEAKRQVSGRVRIDMIAGPSEVLVVADHTAEPTYVAADLLAQAEHDPQALAMCICTDQEMATLIAAAVAEQLPQLERREIAARSLAQRGALLVAADLDEAMELANRLAVEHLELMIADPFAWLPKVRHAGAIFLGKYTPESAGDYLAGPNHVLPTMGTARFSSALGVETFVKKSSLISYSREALLADQKAIDRLARLEGLTGHARSATLRT
ncbi:histidinol dehydrogenase [Desulfurivibrio alkaliphilus]|uniref:Histidinol dehydrogenase n=1 Tax=Desulfurivibrio alkaliphilus (strain DSM 19089 / UNIQEM U267 / AHT2) TaxID=589865 RepID=D6Z4Z8_DESAT|nr:histidinol dehydrogenase [Desulfurivibrio alkaliphilus]ADH86623.1 histidinol dehydrogenase [Desulfurivibrio alkaliphilus AHT 2]